MPPVPIFLCGLHALFLNSIGRVKGSTDCLLYVFGYKTISCHFKIKGAIIKLQRFLQMAVHSSGDDYAIAL